MVKEGVYSALPLINCRVSGRKGDKFKWGNQLNPAGGWAPHSRFLTPPLPSEMEKRIEKKKNTKVELVGWDKTIY